MTRASGRQFARLAQFLTATRVRQHAVLLFVCVWSLYAIDLATPGLVDRGGHIKATDFLHFYVAGWLLRTGHSGALYDPVAQTVWQTTLVPASAGTSFVPMYGPQVYVWFEPLAGLSYGGAALVWVLTNTVLYFACCYAVWRACPQLRSHAVTVFLLAAAYPGFFNLIAFGQSSGPALALFVLALFALRSRHRFLAGLAIGSLIYKPQLGMAAAVILVAAAEWKIVAGAITTAAAQLSFAWAWFGTPVLRDYFHSLLRTEKALPFIEPKLYQMHSLRGFWLLLLPWRHAAAVLYGISAVAVLSVALMCWRSNASLTLRYAVLLIATVLAPPHLMIYDLVILAPALLLLCDWTLANAGSPASAGIRVLLYACYALPWFQPLARVTHVQLSVVAVVGLLWLVWQAMQRPQAQDQQALQAAQT